MSEGTTITINDFENIELCIAKVLEVSEIDGADRLLKLRVDIGSEERQLVAGIKMSYGTEELIGKNIVIVANLKPVRLRGVDSEGMLLAAQTKDGPVLVTSEREAAPGAVVK